MGKSLTDQGVGTMSQVQKKDQVCAAIYPGHNRLSTSDEKCEAIGSHGMNACPDQILLHDRAYHTLHNSHTT